MSSFPPPALDDAPATSQGMNPLLLLVLWFLGSCGVIVAIIVIEIITFTRSNSSLHSSSYMLLFFSLLAGFFGIAEGCLNKSVVRVMAVVVGLLPVEMLTLFLYEVTDPFSTQTSYEQRDAMTPQQWEAVKRQQELTRTHPYSGRDTIDPYHSADQMPSLTGKPEYDPNPGKSYLELARLISQRAVPNLDSAQQHPDTVFISFTVGPYGGVFQAQVQHRFTSDSVARKQAEEAVLWAIQDLQRLHPGRINGKPVSVRVHVAVPVRAQH